LYEKFALANILESVFRAENGNSLTTPWPKQQFFTLKVSAMAIFSNIFLSFSTQNPRASTRGQKSGFSQFFLKIKLIPEHQVFNSQQLFSIGILAPMV
jgi:hypothetical protein